ncbi:hypothetical protein [Anaeromyxobacter oryzisoli]|jgi:hypothetical protein|uniref:hypothetical protein n=1 Tax=Anaeromyxobacter oryzisoli TaxID=2925408 RepID=UPI001F5941F0|nr:hypothetical protein [Anaeromyxobacter sp. SG63]
MAQTDVLDRLRDAMLDERRRAEPRPEEARRRIYVTPSGRVVFGDPMAPPDDAEERMLSEVHPAVFAAPRS